MSLTDPVANYLTLIRNALRARHQKVDIPSSRLLSSVSQILKEEGYINNFKVMDEGSKTFLRIYLRYGPKGEKVISRGEIVNSSHIMAFKTLGIEKISVKKKPVIVFYSTGNQISKKIKIP